MKCREKLAINFAKLSKITIQKIGRVIGRQGTDFPGHLAEKFSPDILQKMKKPKSVICVSGTNGKTTTVNMITDILNVLGENTIDNRIGANTYYGLVSALLPMNGLFSKKPDIGVFEIDELWSRVIFNSFNTDDFVITNLFQDSMERNGNVHYISAVLSNAIKPNTKLFLNADDGFLASFFLENEKIYFSVDDIFNSSEYDSRIQDLIYCPKCEEKLNWHYKRYHHLGKFYCPKCHFTNPTAKYRVIGITDNELNISVDSVEKTLPITNMTIENIYNVIAAYSVLAERGYEHEKLYDAFAKIQVVKSRYDTFIYGNKKIISTVMKGYNPIAASRAFANIVKSEADKTLIILYDNLESSKNDLDERNAAWIFASDLHRLKDEKIKKIFLKVKVESDYVAGFVSCGIDKDKYEIVKNLNDIVDKLENKKEEIFILHDIDYPNVKQANELIKLIREKFKDVNNEN